LAIKTRAGWHDSKLDLGKYLQVGDEVDEEMYDYFLEVLPPIQGPGLLQISEPNDHINGGATYATLQRGAGNRWFYRGHCHRRQSVEPQWTTENLALQAAAEAKWKAFYAR
jgi:hypothetical protein